jgi:Thioredoxin
VRSGRAHRPLGRSRAEAGLRDNAAVSEAAATPIPRRGRLWVILALSLAILGLGWGLVDISTRKAGREVVRIAGASSAQEIFGGVPQAGDRLGPAGAPVSIQVFNDLQCSPCRADFLGTIPSLVERYARAGSVKLLMRHYSVAENALERGFFGAEAAARQGYGWQYTYLFFRNQGEAQRFHLNSDFLASLAGSIEGLEVSEWQQYLDRQSGSGGPIARTLEGYETLGARLGIRIGQAMIVSGPHGTRTLQEGPSLAAVEQAIEAVR